MSKKVMQQALEALENVVSAMYVTSEGEAVALEKVNKAVTILREALEQPVQEPVRLYLENFAAMNGWVKDSGEGAFDYVQRISYAQGVEDATAHARPVQEFVGEVTHVSDNGFKCEFNQRLAVGAKLYTAPPQRPWVGLTEQDMPSGEDPMFDHQYFIAGMVYAAKVLQAKNT
jgi:hypothetical protein